MKRLVLFVSVALLLSATACNSDKLHEAQEENEVLDDSLRVALANQDSLLSLLNDITDGMDQIKNLEQILTSSVDLNAETQSRKESIHNDMMAIQQALQERRERLAQLEKKLAKSNHYTATLRKTIENLKASISEQATTIESLRHDLAAANIQIEKLDMAIDSLHNTVDTISAAKAATERQLTATTNEMNTVYYVVGNKAELKAHNIIEGGGFLRKAKIMSSDFDQNYFTTADKRKITQIPLYSKKAKLLTRQPATSYEIIEDANGQKTLRITNATEFWRVSNYLVVQID
jgi:predicted RNase H-like nuclease (RuvC/YqgF family)